MLLKFSFNIQRFRNLVKWDFFAQKLERPYFRRNFNKLSAPPISFWQKRNAELHKGCIIFETFDFFEDDITFDDAFHPLNFSTS